MTRLSNESVRMLRDLFAKHAENGATIFHQAHAEELLALAEEVIAMRSETGRIQELERELSEARMAAALHENSASHCAQMVVDMLPSNAPSDDKPHDDTPRVNQAIAEGLSWGQFVWLARQLERELAAMPSAVARSDLADELARLGSKATQGPWSSNILRDFRGHSGSNDTPYVYGPGSHPKLLMGLWPIHPPEETAAVEQRMFDTLDLICALRNHLPEIIAALRTQSATALWISTNERLPEDETPVLIVWNGQTRIGEIRWDHPGHEETYVAFRYWDDPTDDGQAWDWREVTHWMPLPSAPTDRSSAK